MKNILYLILLLIQAPHVLAEKTFGFPHVNELPEAETKFIDERIVPIKLLALNPSSTMDSIFTLLPNMNKEGDRGPIGRDYFSVLPETHFYTYFKVQKDRKGIHNISFRSAFSKPSLEEVERIVAWLLTVFGEPTIAFTRDLDKEKPGAELLALVWEKEGITVGFTLHYASGVHSSIVASRNNTRVNELFSTQNKIRISSKTADIIKAANLWATSIAGLEN